MAEQKPVYGPDRSIGEFTSRAQLLPSGRRVIRCRRRSGKQEISVSLDLDDAERLIASIAAALRDAQTLGAHNG